MGMDWRLQQCHFSDSLLENRCKYCFLFTNSLRPISDDIIIFLLSKKIVCHSAGKNRRADG